VEAIARLNAGDSVAAIVAELEARRLRRQLEAGEHGVNQYTAGGDNGTSAGISPSAARGDRPHLA
jgi:hypothetical protein